MAVSPLHQSKLSQSPIRTAVAAAAARQGSTFGPMLREIAKLPGSPSNEVSKGGQTTYRFDDQTWLRLVQTYGTQHGLGMLAEQVTTDSNGGREARNPEAGLQILKLREDPEVARVMAQHLAREHAGVLQGALGRAPTDQELYLSHLLGPDKAARFVRLHAANPAASATDLFPGAARRYPDLFGSKAAPATLEEVAKRLAAGSIEAAKAPAATAKFAKLVTEAALPKAAGLISQTGFTPSGTGLVQ